MAHTIEHTQTLTSMTCGVPGCGIAFAIPASLYRKANDDHGIWFYCPNGHHIHFLGKSDTEKASERAEWLSRQLANRDEDVRAARASLIATKGHLTRTKKRAEKGVCLHCNRHFANVQRHVESQHPETVNA